MGLEKGALGERIIDGEGLDAGSQDGMLPDKGPGYLPDEQPALEGIGVDPVEEITACRKGDDGPDGQCDPVSAGNPVGEQDDEARGRPEDGRPRLREDEPGEEEGAEDAGGPSDPFPPGPVCQ